MIKSCLKFNKFVVIYIKVNESINKKVFKSSIKRRRKTSKDNKRDQIVDKTSETMDIRQSRWEEFAAWDVIRSSEALNEIGFRNRVQTYRQWIFSADYDNAAMAFEFLDAEDPIVDLTIMNMDNPQEVANKCRLLVNRPDVLLLEAFLGITDVKEPHWEVVQTMIDNWHRRNAVVMAYWPLVIVYQNKFEVIQLNAMALAGLRAENALNYNASALMAKGLTGVGRNWHYNETNAEDWNTAIHGVGEVQHIRVDDCIINGQNKRLWYRLSRQIGINRSGCPRYARAEFCPTPLIGTALILRVQALTAMATALSPNNTMATDLWDNNFANGGAAELTQIHFHWIARRICDGGPFQAMMERLAIVLVDAYRQQELHRVDEPQEVRLAHLTRFKNWYNLFWEPQVSAITHRGPQLGIRFVLAFIPSMLYLRNRHNVTADEYRFVNRAVMVALQRTIWRSSIRQFFENPILNHSYSSFRELLQVVHPYVGQNFEFTRQTAIMVREDSKRFRRHLNWADNAMAGATHRRVLGVSQSCDDGGYPMEAPEYLFSIFARKGFAPLEDHDQRVDSIHFNYWTRTQMANGTGYVISIDPDVYNTVHENLLLETQELEDAGGVEVVEILQQPLVPEVEGVIIDEEPVDQSEEGARVGPMPGEPDPENGSETIVVTDDEETEVAEDEDNETEIIESMNESQD